MRSRALREQDGAAHVREVQQGQIRHVQWQHELQRSPSAPSFARALILDSLPTLLPASLIAVLESAMQITQAVCLGMLVSILNREDASDAVPEMLGWAAVVSATSVVALVCHQHFFFATWRQGLRARAATVGLLFHKSLRLSMDSLAHASIGHVVTLASDDSHKRPVAAEHLQAVVHHVRDDQLVCVLGQAARMVEFGLGVAGDAFAPHFEEKWYRQVPAQCDGGIECYDPVVAVVGNEKPIFEHRHPARKVQLVQLVTTLVGKTDHRVVAVRDVDLLHATIAAVCHVEHAVCFRKCTWVVPLQWPAAAVTANLAKVRSSSGN